MSNINPSPAGSVIDPNIVVPPAEVLKPAANIPKPVVANADTILERIKAKVKEANKNIEPGTGVSTAPGDDPPKEDKKPAEIKPDDKQLLAELAKAQAKLREVQDKLKAQDALAGDAEYGKKVKDKWAKGNQERLELLAELAGKNAEEVLADFVEMFYEQSGGATLEQKKDQPKPPAELKLVLDKLEAVSKELADIKAGTSAKTEAEIKAAQERETAGTNAYLKSLLDKYKGEFEISARADNQDEAVNKAREYAPKALKRLQDTNQLPADTSGDKFTPEQLELIARTSIEMAEEDFRTIARRYGSVQAPPPRVSSYDRPISKPGLVVAKKKPNETFEETKARYRAAWEQAGGNR